MDYEDIIKLEQESPVYSTGNNSHALKHCMASFYDNDSELFRGEPQEQDKNSQQISFEQAIDYIQNYVDIIDTPLDDILRCFQKMQYAQDLDKLTLIKKILKRKNLFKRYRAKTRQPKLICSYQQFSEITIVNAMETEAEIKKKRNRVSAQISRDRKKQYFKELEMKNQKLQEEIIRARLENEKLKRQIEYTDDTPQMSNINSETFNNKLTKLLIFLGILCLIGMLKETFASTTESFSKFKTAEKLDNFSPFSAMRQTKMIEQGQRKVAEFLQNLQVQKMHIDDKQEKGTIASQFSLPERNGQKRHFFQGLIEKLTEMKAGIEKNFN